MTFWPILEYLHTKWKSLHFFIILNWTGQKSIKWGKTELIMVYWYISDIFAIIFAIIERSSHQIEKSTIINSVLPHFGTMTLFWKDAISKRPLLKKTLVRKPFAQKPFVQKSICYYVSYSWFGLWTKRFKKNRLLNSLKNHWSRAYSG